MSRKNRRNDRKQQGTAIMEFGPALLFLCLLFYAFIDLLGLGTTYLACFTLNDLQVTAASVRSVSETEDPQGVVQRAIPDAWAASGLGNFVHLVEKPVTTVAYKDLLPGGQDQIVSVTTVLKPRPLLSIPYFSGIPGLSAPLQFTFYSERVVERSDLTANKHS